MIVLFWVAIVMALLFGFVVLFGAPYVPTLAQQTKEALDMLNLRPGQTLVELGSGDSRIQIEAAKRGIYSVGYELNPILVLWARLMTLKYRKYAAVKWGNFWRQPLPETDAIYTFLLNKYMPKLHTKIEQEKPNWNSKKRLKVVSFAFEITDKQPVAQSNGLFLYHY
jgi:hypothetical protein